MGGDWNCTVDCRNVDLNIDVLNMAGIPSKLRSEKVKYIFTKYKLTDPYRYFYPNKREFTYIPANLDATNRSRLNLFGVSETLVTKIGSCGISNALTNPSFDHKEIFISFKKDRPYPKNKQVQNNSIKNKYVKTQVKTAAIECYLQHLVPGPNTTVNFIEENLNKVGRVLSALDRLNKTRLDLSLAGTDALRILKEELEIELDDLVENLPGFRFLEVGNLSCEPEFFFEALCCSTREAAVKQQDVMYKLKTETEKHLSPNFIY